MTDEMLNNLGKLYKSTLLVLTVDECFDDAFSVKISYYNSQYN